MCILFRFVSAVWPVAVLSMAFWTVCSEFMFVSFIIGDKMVLLYSITGLVMALYVCIRVSFDFPQFVPDIALYMFVVFCALIFVVVLFSFSYITLSVIKLKQSYGAF